MRNGLNKTDVDNILNSLPAGVSRSEKAAFTKLECNGNRIYVGRATICRDVHLAGFGKGMPGTVAPKTHNGTVQAWLDMDSPDALQNLRQFIDMLPTLGAFKPTKSFTPRKTEIIIEEKQTATTAPLSKLSKEEKAKRRALIAEVAKQRGATISAETESLLADVTEEQ